MKNLRQTGSAVVVVLLIVILIVVVGLAGYVVYKSQNKASQLSTDASFSQSDENKLSEQTSDDTGYLHIKEWGVKIKLDPALGKVTYKHDSSGEDAIFSSDLQATLPDSCNYRNDSPWGIGRSKQESVVGNPPIKIGDYYYSALYPQTGCEDARAIMEPLSGAYGRTFTSLSAE